MIQWGQVFSRAANSGVVETESVSTGEIRQAAQMSELAFYHLNLAHISGKDGFLKAAADALEFPAYFGANWDAFEECLTDLSWHDAKGVVLLVEEVEPFDRDFPEVMETARDIFESVTSYWRGLDTCFFVVLGGHLELTSRPS